MASSQAWLVRIAAGLLAAVGGVVVLGGLAGVGVGDGVVPEEDLVPAEAAKADALADELDRRLAEDVAPLFRTYCFECHQGEKVKGGVHLDALRSVRDVLVLREDVSMAREMVVTRQMPPEGEAQPSDHERLILQQWFDGALAYVPPDAPVDPGWFTIHRLNRLEYRNTLRDLLGIDPAREDLAARLPRDDTGYGFDNIADVLSTSPLAIEAYLDAAERAVQLALGPELEFGGAARRIAALEGGNGRPLPSGGHFLFSNGAVHGRFEFPATGEYTVRLRAWETHGGDENARLELRIAGKTEAKFEVRGTREDPEEFEARVRVTAGQRLVAAVFTNDFYEANVADRNVAVEWISVAGPMDEATTERPAQWMEVFGAGGRDEAGAAANPGAAETARAREILSRFAARAYRRPLTADEADDLSRRFGRVRSQGRSFESSVRLVLTSVLVSPNFLFRSVSNPDAGDPQRVYELSGYELAGRLSYFFWSSMPDEELLALAADGSLVRPEILAAQARRMLADPKSRAFVESFASQWLQLRALDTIAIDTASFPEFDPALRASMAGEATGFFADVVRNDRSVLTFLDSDRAFLDERLARFYGIDGVTGPEFREVTLPEASPRGGVLTMGAVLTVTSNTTRTSPVKRGLFVLDQILGAPPPPPPADIPPLEQAKMAGADATLREQLAVHVANPTCAVCHNRLDPIGLALENFDAIGRWRDQERGKPLDVSGVLPGGVAFNGPAELKKILMGRADEFVETLSGKVLTYAIGRGLEPFDRPTVREITTATRAEGDRIGAMIEAVVLSEAFRTCRGRERAEDGRGGDAEQGGGRTGGRGEHE